MSYAMWDDYIDLYLLGREPKIPESEFNFWIKKACSKMDLLTFRRLNDSHTFEENIENIINCVCELAEYYYVTEDNIGKTAQSVAGHSVTYMRGGDNAIVFEHLGTTGLLFSGV